MRAHNLPETSGVNTREILFLLVAIVASARSGSGSTGTACDNVVLVLVVNQLLVIVGHIEVESKRRELKRNRSWWQVVAEERRGVA